MAPVMKIKTFIKSAAATHADQRVNFSLKISPYNWRRLIELPCDQLPINNFLAGIWILLNLCWCACGAEANVDLICNKE